MKNNFIEELKWRGLLHDVMPGTEALLLKESVVGYVGFDPTAKSLTIGNLVTVMLLVHFQRCGHKPMALVGGATGMIGDPSFKNEERKFLSDEDVRFNMECIKNQLEHFLDFDESNSNCAEIVNNYDWFKDISFLQFLRDVGKHLTINYMCAKDSVKKRLETGLSFTEFSYQLLQGHDFYHLNQTKNVKLQMGGSDQWGNITSGNELIRRRSGNESYALTCPLLTKPDGTKFGKSEGQNIWLDGDLTSPYKFYQFWLNTSDEEAIKYIKIFTTFDQLHISNLEAEHNASPHLRLLQKELAKDITCRVHSEDDYQQAVDASEILFGKGTFESLNKLNNNTILSIFEGVPQSNISRVLIDNSLDVVEFLVATNVFESKAEARRMLKSNAIGINKNKITEGKQISKDDLVNNKYIIVQKGKKNYHLVVCD